MEHGAAESGYAFLYGFLFTPTDLGFFNKDVLAILANRALGFFADGRYSCFFLAVDTSGRSLSGFNAVWICFAACHL
jgi:hypothetical protein